MSNEEETLKKIQESPLKKFQESFNVFLQGPTLNIETKKEEVN